MRSLTEKTEALFGLVVADLEMPHLRGFQMLKIAKVNVGGQGRPLVNIVAPLGEAI